MSLVNTLKNLKSNLFGGPGNTGFSKPPPSKVQSIGMTGTPVSSLDSNPLSFGTYQFPKDVFENQQLGHYLVFYVNVQDRTKYSYGKTGKQVREIKQAELKAYNDGTSVGNSGFVDLKGEYANKKEYYTTREQKNKSGNFYRDGKDSIDLADSSRNSAALQGLSSVRKTTKRITDSIALYLPANVLDTTSATYEDTPTGLLGVGLTDLLTIGSAAEIKDFETMGKTGGKVLKDFIEASFKRAGGAFVEALSGSEGAIPLANKVFGQADNPFVEVFFNTMNVRTFTYNFNFAPRNEAETNEIQQIIQLFRFHMAPELQATNSRYLTLPSEFDIHYMYKANNGQSYENDYYGRIGTCVLENVTTNFTPNGVKSFANGAPTQITMNLTFRETETLTKEKINQGY